MKKSNEVDLREQKPQITKFKDCGYSTRIVFNDRSNTSYNVVKESYKEIGIVDSYKDFISRGLNPNIDNHSNIYGIAKRLEPKTTTINRMKASIDNANQKLNNYINQIEKQKQFQQEQKAQTQEEVGETNDK